MKSKRNHTFLTNMCDFHDSKLSVITLSLYSMVSEERTLPWLVGQGEHSCVGQVWEWLSGIFFWVEHWVRSYETNKERAITKAMKKGSWRPSKPNLKIPNASQCIPSTRTDSPDLWKDNLSDPEVIVDALGIHSTKYQYLQMTRKPCDDCTRNQHMDNSHGIYDKQKRV